MGKNRASRTAARAERTHYPSADIDFHAKPQQSVQGKHGTSTVAADGESDISAVKPTDRKSARSALLPVSFAQRLAHSEKKTRDANLNRLRVYLQRSQSLSDANMSKLFKGIFYCYWLSDSQPVQMELAERLSACMDDMDPDRYLLFVRGFLSMLGREWTGIDRLRIDKFMSWIRIFFQHSLRYLQSHQWESALVAQWLAAHSEIPLSNDNVHRGLFLFYTDIYVSELGKVAASGPLPWQALHSLLGPYEAIVTQCRDVSMVKRVRESVCDALINIATEDQGSDEMAAMHELLVRQATQLAKWFFAMASAKSTVEKHRLSLYEFCDQFNAIAQQSQESEATNGKKRKNSNIANGTEAKVAKRRKVAEPEPEIAGGSVFADADADLSFDDSGLSVGDDANGNDEDDEDDDDVDVATILNGDDDSDDDGFDAQHSANGDEDFEAAAAQEAATENADEGDGVPMGMGEDVDANEVASADDDLFLSAAAFDTLHPHTNDNAKRSATHSKSKKKAKTGPVSGGTAKDVVELAHSPNKEVAKHAVVEHESPAKSATAPKPSQSSPAKATFQTPKPKKARMQDGVNQTPVTEANGRTPRSVRIDETRNGVKEFHHWKKLDDAGNIDLSKPSPKPAISRRSLEVFESMRTKLVRHSPLKKANKENSPN